MIKPTTAKSKQILMFWQWYHSQTLGPSLGNTLIFSKKHERIDDYQDFIDHYLDEMSVQLALTEYKCDTRWMS